MTKFDGALANITPAKAWYLTFVMFLAYVVGQIDRMVVVMLAEQMKRSLHFSDEQLGLLMGLAFTLTYAVGALVFAGLARRVGRKRMLIGAVLLWSLLTMNCALLKSFPALVLVRLGVGLCEGCLAPAALPMVSAAFSAERRSMPIALCISGASIGSIIAPIMTGSIVGATAGLQFGPFPLVGIVFGWQSAFLVAGAIGLVIAVLMLTVTEPREGDSEDKSASAAAGVLPYFREHWLFSLAILVAVPFAMAPGFALLTWMPAYLERTFALAPEEAGAMITFAATPSAIVGPFLGGFLGQFVARMSDRRQYLTIMLGLGAAINGVIALPMLMPTAVACSILFAIMVLVMNIYVTLGLISSQQLLPAPLRGHGAAVFLAVQLLGGVGLGSFIVGFLTTRVVGEQALHLAMLLLIVLTLPLSAAILGAGRQVRQVPV